MKNKLTSEFDGAVKIEDVPVYYSILPDGRRVIVGGSEKSKLGELIGPNTTGLIKFQDTHGNHREGIDVQKFPDIITSHVHDYKVSQLEHYMPWLIFKGLFVFGMVALLVGLSKEENRVDFNKVLRDTIK